MLTSVRKTVTADDEVIQSQLKVSTNKIYKEPDANNCLRRLVLM